MTRGRLTIAAVLAAAVVLVPGAALASGGAPSSFSFDAEIHGDWSAVGHTLSVDPGVWINSPSVSPQWFRCAKDGTNCFAIAGATSFSYTLQSADLSHRLYA